MIHPDHTKRLTATRLLSINTEGERKKWDDSVRDSVVVITLFITYYLFLKDIQFLTNASLLFIAWMVPRIRRSERGYAVQHSCQKYSAVSFLSALIERSNYKAILWHFAFFLKVNHAPLFQNEFEYHLVLYKIGSDFHLVACFSDPTDAGFLRETAEGEAGLPWGVGYGTTSKVHKHPKVPIIWLWWWTLKYVLLAFN